MRQPAWHGFIYDNDQGITNT